MPVQARGKQSDVLRERGKQSGKQSGNQKERSDKKKQQEGGLQDGKSRK
jgi:hypothetical protein